MKKTQALLSTALSVAVIPFATGIAQAATIALLDPLDTAQSVLIPSPSTSTIPVTGTIFGATTTRQVTVNQTAGTANTISVDIPQGNSSPGLDYTSGSGRNGNFSINYGFPNPVDLSVGSIVEEITFPFVDLASPGGTIAVTINGNTVTKNLPLSTPTDLKFLLSEFPAAAIASATSFSILVDPITNGDYSFGPIALTRTSLIPEPSAVLALLAVGGAVAFKGKKRA